MDALDIFCEVIELREADRAAAVARLCGDRPDLRHEVEELLRNHDAPATLVQTRSHQAGLSQLLRDDASDDSEADRVARPNGMQRACFVVAGVMCVTLVTWWLASGNSDAPAMQRGAADANGLDLVVTSQRYAGADSEGDVAFLDEGTPCAALPTGNRVRVLDLQSGAELAACVTPGMVRTVRIDALRHSIGTWSWQRGAATSHLMLWDLRRGTNLKHHTVSGAAATNLEFASGGAAMQWSERGLSHRLAIATGERQVLSGRGAGADRLVWSASRKRSVAISEDGFVRLAHAESDDVQLLGRHAGGMIAAAFSADEEWLATAGSDDRVRVWSLANTRAVQVIARSATRLALSRDGSQLLTLGRGEAALLSLGTGQR